MQPTHLEACYRETAIGLEIYVRADAFMGGMTPFTALIGSGVCSHMSSNVIVSSERNPEKLLGSAETKPVLYNAKE